MLDIMQIGILLGITVVIGFLIKRDGKSSINSRVKNRQLEEQNKSLQEQLLELEDLLGEEREKNRSLLSQKKSSETRLGQISEHIVPFLEKCPYKPKDMHFLGNPIDYLVFDLDEGRIIFSEVKSGNSRASKRQKTIKNIIKSGRVFYEEIRINTKGVTVKPTYPDNHKEKIDAFVKTKVKKK